MRSVSAFRIRRLVGALWMAGCIAGAVNAQTASSGMYATDPTTAASSAPTMANGAPLNTDALTGNSVTAPAATVPSVVTPTSTANTGGLDYQPATATAAPAPSSSADTAGIYVAPSTQANSVSLSQVAMPDSNDLSTTLGPILDSPEISYCLYRLRKNYDANIDADLHAIAKSMVAARQATVMTDTYNAIITGQQPAPAGFNRMLAAQQMTAAANQISALQPASDTAQNNCAIRYNNR